MFLNLLEDDEKRAFAELAGRMIDTDGIVVGREAAVLAALMAEMGLAGDEATQRSVEELAGVFSSRSSKIAALLELIGLGYSDTNYTVTERSLVSQAAEAMAVNSDELAHIEGWVKRHVELIKQALVMMRD
jgi:hypothetical protein